MPSLNTQIDAITPSGTITAPDSFSITSIFNTLDPSTADKITVTGDNLIATNADAGLGVAMGVRAFAPQTSGKYYFEIEWTAIPFLGTNGGLAIGPPGTDPMDLSEGNNGACPAGVLLKIDLFVDAYGVQTATSLTTPPTGQSAGDVLGCAVDLDHGFVWFIVAGGPDVGLGWNGDGSNPGANIGGIPLQTGVALVPYIIFEQNSVVGDGTIAVNFGDSPYSNPQIPLGFTFWPVP